MSKVIERLKGGPGRPGMIKIMKVIEKYQNSSLNNRDVRWYLFDGTLWITKCNNYYEIEDNIQKSFGSFQWLYDSNDTVLFNDEGRFESAVIDLVDVKNGTLKKYTDLIKTGKKGDLFIAEKKYYSLEFLPTVIYSENEDILLSVPIGFENQKTLMLFIVDDFGFVIVNHQLKGWILKNASEYVCIKDQYNKNITPKMLEKFFNGLKLWDEKEDSSELEILLAESMKRMKEDDEFICALRECIMDL